MTAITDFELDMLPGRVRTPVDSDATDRGGIAWCPPRAVVRPRATDEVVEVVRACARLRMPVRARGAGTQMGGQALTSGVCVDMTEMNAVRDVGTGYIDVEAGVTIRDAMATAWCTGQRLTSGPEVDFTATVGGALSAGGWSTVVREGSLADRCLGLELVTGTGTRMWCSRSAHPDLFRMALGGQGTAGVITRAQLELCQVPPFARTWLRTYTDPAALLEDMRTLSLRDHVTDLAALWRPGGEIQLLATGYWMRKPPASGWVMRNLESAEMRTHDDTYFGALTENVQTLRAPGRGRAPAARVAALLGRGVDEVIGALMRDRSVTHGVLVPHVATAVDRRMSLRVPAVSDITGLMWLVDAVSSAEHLLDEQWPAWRRAQLRRTRDWRDRAVRVGGVHYPTGTAPAPDEREHFGDVCAARNEVLARLDPHALFGPWGSSDEGGRW